jgi:predicted DNA-binding transcriptional regulator YafY
MKREKAENLIRLIGFLSTRKLKAGEIARLLNVQIKQVRRYFQTLEDLEIHVDEDLDGRCFLFGANKIQRSELDIQEKNWLTSMIKIHAPTHPFAASIANKLAEEPLPLPLPEQLTDARIAANFEKITSAIQTKVRIILQDYHSPRGAKITSNRLVEPLAFIDEHRQLKAYEVASRKVKSFKIDRIAKVKLTSEPCVKLSLSPSYADPFGFSHTKYQVVIIKLSPLAKDLMYETFLDSRKYIYEEQEAYHYHGPMCNPIGIGRFILGLPGHTQIIEGEELRTYLNNELLKFNF